MPLDTRTQRTVDQMVHARTLDLQNRVNELEADRDQGAKDYCDLRAREGALMVQVQSAFFILKSFVSYFKDPNSCVDAELVVADAERWFRTK